jgi:plastocyanin
VSLSLDGQGSTPYTYRFNPMSLSASGGRITVTLHNTSTGAGGAPHTFNIGNYSTGTVEPGASASVSFVITKPGDYNFYCEYHQSEGMTGTLQITS